MHTEISQILLNCVRFFFKLVLAFHEMSKIPSNCTRFSFGSHARPHNSFFSFTTSPLIMLGIKIHVCRCGFCNKDRNCVTYVAVAFYLIEHLHCSIYVCVDIYCVNFVDYCERKEHCTDVHEPQIHLRQRYNLPRKVNGVDTIIHRTRSIFIITCRF